MKFARFPKFSVLSLLAGVFALALAGCGGTNNLALTQGNWAFSASSAAPVKAAGPTFVLGGNLTQNGDKLSGRMYITQSLCIPPQFISFSGTVKGKDVTLTSASFGGQVISVTASGANDSLTGAYTITGECADSGTLTASAVPSISGTWSGPIPITTQGVAQPTLSVALTQAATPSEDGTFALSGTLTYANSLCPLSGTITNGYLAGNFISFNATTVDTGDSTGTVSFDQVVLDSITSPKNMTGTYDYESLGDCGSQIQALTLTKQ